jgi:hypothetical protein
LFFFGKKKQAKKETWCHERKTKVTVVIAK